MAVITETFGVSTRGKTDIIDITGQVERILGGCGLAGGIACIAVPGATAGITTVEFEPGLCRDLPAAFERLAPENITYAHDETWHDGNGHSHVRAALLGASYTVPFSGGAPVLGTWQQIVLIDFDNRPRNREITVQIMGE